jgi:type IV secretion system protein VirD4
VARAYKRSSKTDAPLDPPLLVVLDECANIAPLRELATLASTGAGQVILLVSLFQDMAQINAGLVILSGIADAQTLDYVARLLGEDEINQT